MLPPDEPRLWAELLAATGQHAHAWRTPVLATVDADGSPNARTVVLRSVDAASRSLACFTDARSPKVKELAVRPQAMLVFWCPVLRWQLRARAVVTVEAMGPAVEAAWARIAPSRAARDYLAPAPPGAPWSGADPASEPASGDRPHFCILRAEVTALDWLGLSTTGEHQRIRFEAGQAQPLVP